MAITNKTGQTLTARQQKAQVLKWTGWTSEQYNKEYDKLRNRVRNYERANGYERGSINVADVLAREARVRHYAPRFGETAQSTQLYMAVSATTSQSTGKALTASGRTNSQTAAIAAISGRYHGLLEKSNIVQTAVAELKANNPNYTAAEYEATILKAARRSNALGHTAETIRKAFLRKGIIVAKQVDTL